MEADDIANHYAAVAKHYQVLPDETLIQNIVQNDLSLKRIGIQGVVYSNPSDREYQREVSELCRKYLDLQPHHLLVDLAGRITHILIISIINNIDVIAIVLLLLFVL